MFLIPDLSLSTKSRVAKVSRMLPICSALELVVYHSASALDVWIGRRFWLRELGSTVNATVSSANFASLHF